MKKIYVGNLPPTTTEEQLRELFADHGPRSVQIVLDRVTGQGRGIGFVMLEDDIAQAAVAALNGRLFESRSLRVLEHSDRLDALGYSPRGGGGGDTLVPG